MQNRSGIFKFFVFLFAIMLLFVGCRKPGPETKPAGAVYDPAKDPLVNPPVMFEPLPKDISQVATDETLFLVLEGNPNTLNPLFLSSGDEVRAAGPLYTGLFTFDKEFIWRPNEEIVESFKESEDHTEFIVKMKPGFTWHDGQPFTAHDVVYSWQQILDPQVPCQTEKATTSLITECIALDDYTIKYIQPQPTATRHWNLGFVIIPKHIFEKEKANHPDLKTGEYYIRQARHPVGNGAYRIVEWKENDKIVVERWEEYKGKKPYFKRIVFRIIPDTNMALLSFEKENVDVIDRLSSQQFAFETNEESFSKVGYKAWGSKWQYSYIGWNMDGSNPFFADKKVRYAMTHALNIPLILEKISYNLSPRCRGIYHPESWMYNPDIKMLDYDLEKSRALLDEAGWKVSPEDGWRYKDIGGEKVKFEFEMSFSQGSPTAPRIAAMFQQDLKKIGVEMKTRVMEWATYMEKTLKHEFQANMAAWGTAVDPDLSWNLWRTEEYKTGRNYGGYSNPRVDELFELGRKEFDFEARRKIYQEIHKLIYEDQPYIWINNIPLQSAINKRIRGIQFSPRGIFGFNPAYEAWWVPAGQARKN